MSTPAYDNWDPARQSFLDQFEQDPSGFVYRRSQKGEAIRVSAEERSRFLKEFDRSVSRSKWILYAGMAVVLGGIILLSVRKGFELSQLAVFAGIGAVMIPYFAYYRWAWSAPARELAGRTPIAGERSAEDVRRLRFRRISYGQLLGAAGAGLALPLLGDSRGDLFSGWNRLWLAAGGVVALLAVVQAVRKWRFEQEDSWGAPLSASSPSKTAEPLQKSAATSENEIWRYLPFGLIVLGTAFVAFTSVGKRISAQPSFWPLLIAGFGAWSLITVAKGIAKGRIQPFVQGFYTTYGRETQPKRFWASVAWNSALGCGCLGLVFAINGQVSAEATERECYNQGNAFTAEQELAACNKLVSKADDNHRPYLLVARAFAYERLNNHSRALIDFNEAIRLRPSEPFSLFNRGLMYQLRGDTRPAISDFTAVIALKPEWAEAYLQRGSAYQHLGLASPAIADFNKVISLKPNFPQGYYYRGEAYADVGNDDQAKADYATATRLDPKLSNPYSSRPSSL